MRVDKTGLHHLFGAVPPQYGLAPVGGWSPAFATRVRDYAWRTFMERYTVPEINGLLMAELLPELLAAVVPAGASSSSSAAGTGRQKLTIFAGHDACPMMPVLVALGPPYIALSSAQLLSLRLLSSPLLSSLLLSPLSSPPFPSLSPPPPGTPHRHTVPRRSA